MRLGILALALLIGGAVFGQEKGHDHGQKGPKTAEERATQVTERLTKQLGLSDEQKAKIYEINVGIAQKNEAIRANNALTKEQRMAQIKENHAARKAMYKDVMNAEQYAKYEAWEKEKQAKMEAKRKEKEAKEKTDKATKGAKGKGGKATKGGKKAPESKETEEVEDLENEL